MLVIGCDHGGYGLKEELKKYFEEAGIEYNDVGTYSEESVNYPEFAEKVARAIQNGSADKGILICKTGNGMTITANKFKGVRCALCDDEERVKLARQHNDANVLAIGADYVSVSNAIVMIRTFLATEFSAGRHEHRVNMIKDIENEIMK